MIIFLGRESPRASSDLPGSRNGSGRFVSDSLYETPRFAPICNVQPVHSAPLFGLAPDGVCRAKPVTRPAGELLPRRFTLTGAVMPRAPRPRRFVFCGTVPIRAASRALGRWVLPTIAP